MSNRYEIRLTGSGGQGLILAGIIIAEAGLLDGKHAIQTQSYGPEARGGASKAEVIISDEEIDFPKAGSADVLLALTQASYDIYAKTVKPDGVIIADSTIEFDPDKKPARIVHVPIIHTAAQTLGKGIVANIVAIGFISEFTDVVTRDSIEKAVLARVPKGTEALNKSALEEGYKLALQHK